MADWSTSNCVLVLAENNKDNPDCIRNIFDPSSNKSYQLSLPETFGARCWGSSYGWIVTLTLDRQIFLFNPLTKARIDLPSQSTMPYQLEPRTAEDVDEGEDHVALNALDDRDFFVTKFLVIKDDESNNNDDDFVVLAIVGSWKGQLALARPGDKTWTSVDPPEYTTEDDFPYYNGPFHPSYPPPVLPPVLPFRHRVVDFVVTGTRVVFLYLDASLGYLDISDLRERQQNSKVNLLLPGIPKGLEIDTITANEQMYLLTDSSGDLLLVIRIKEDLFTDDNDPNEIYNDFTYKTTDFEVYRLNSDIEEWESLDQLGDLALFVGVGNSLSVRAPDDTGDLIRSNCIYFTDDFVERWMLTNFGGHDIGVFDFESKEIEKFYKGDDNYSKFCPPFWFVPSV